MAGWSVVRGSYSQNACSKAFAAVEINSSVFWSITLCKVV